jgi:regulator of sigma E protease
LKTLQIIGILIEVVLIFNLLIIVHELGHFLAARWRGLHVDGFGIWFGKPIWKKKINGVVYSLGSIPAGGFVKLPQMAPMEAIEGESEVPREALKPISPLDKIIVAFAGPLFSFGLAAVFAVFVYILGRPVSEPEGTKFIGYVEPNSPAATAGLQPGDEIIKVDGQDVSRFAGMGNDSIIWRIVRSEGETIPIVVNRNVDGVVKQIEVAPKPVIPKTRGWQRSQLRQVGIQPAETPVVGMVKAGSTAEQAGVKKGDQIIEAAGQRVYNFTGLSSALEKNSHGPLSIKVKRGEEFQTLSLPVEGATIGTVVTGSPAEKAGLMKGDTVLGIDGIPNRSAIGLTEYIRSHGDRQIAINIDRAGTKKDITVTPAVPEGEDKPYIGIVWQESFGGIEFNPRGLTVIDHPKPGAQLKKAARSIVDTIGAIASKSDIGIQHMGGPVMMMRAYYTFFEMDFADGWRRALWFSVLINVNLALMNLLPLPVLDGGHITIAMLEAIRRRPVSLRVLEPIQTVCVLLLMGFMAFITFFDVQDLPFFGSRERALKFKPTPAAERSK